MGVQTGPESTVWSSNHKGGSMRMGVCQYVPQTCDLYAHVQATDMWGQYVSVWLGLGLRLAVPWPLWDMVMEGEGLALLLLPAGSC